MIAPKTLGPGILLCLAIAILSWMLGNIYPLIGGPVFGMLIGMLLTLVFPKSMTPFQKGVTFTAKKLLQYAIILLGFGLNLFTVFKVGGQSLVVILFTLLAAFVTAWLVGKLLKLDGKMTTLIGVGTAICGGSAIAAAAPVIRAKDEDITHAISTIFLFNIIAVFLFPPLGHLLHLGDAGFGMWAGTAINDTSSVVAAGTVWSTAIGNNTALHFATIVKLTRTLMIIPITLFLGFYTAHSMKGKTSEKSSFHFAKVFPWFVISFLASVMITTFVPLPSPLPLMLSNAGKFLIVMAMVGIGLSTHLKKLLLNGTRPILLGLSCWLTVAVTSLLVQNVLRIW